MHDLHVADKIVKLAREYAALNQLKEVLELNVTLGRVLEHNEEIHPENLIFNIKLLTEKEPLFAACHIVITTNNLDNYWQLESIKGN